MSLETRLVELAQAIGADIKQLRANDGVLSSLTTTAKSNLVAAINEINAALTSAGNAVIDDTAGDGVTDKVWSADKVHDVVEAAKLAVKNDLTDGAGAALDTLAELAAALNNDPNFAATVATDLSNRVRYDAAQVLDDTQKKRARDNIGAASAADVGNTERNYVADYETARDA